VRDDAVVQQLGPEGAHPPLRRLHVGDVVHLEGEVVQSRRRRAERPVALLPEREHEALVVAQEGEAPAVLPDSLSTWSPRAAA
jgi:hypothetical protein